MKRLLSALLCAILLLGLLPMVTPPALMITQGQFEPTSVYTHVGDTIEWRVMYSNGTGPFSYEYFIRRDGVMVYASPYTEEESVPSLYYVPALPGKYLARCIVKDAEEANYIIIDTDFYAIVSLRPAPVVSSVEAVSGTRLKVSWNKVAGATGYYVERSTRETSGFKRVKTTTTATSFTDSGLTPGKAYYYKVRTYNLVRGAKIVSSGNSNIRGGMPLAAPNLTRAATINRTWIALNWSAVTGATHYQVWKSASGGPWERVTFTKMRSCDVVGLTRNTTYRFRIVACKQYENSFLWYYSPSSNIRSAKTWK